MISRRALLLALTVALPCAAATGCSDDPTQPDVVPIIGTYSLVSISIDGGLALTPPAVDGTLTITDTTYDIIVSIELPGVEGVDERGTYELTATEWSQRSQEGVEATGTYTLDGDRLTISSTFDGQAVVAVWDRTF